MIIPKHDLVVRPFWALSSADESENIASEEHLDNSDATVQLYMVQSEISSFLIKEARL